jgi:hypothetical protein
MSETLLSPGVFSLENDQTQITQGPITVGAALIGPTVLGPVYNPTVVTSYSDFKSKFGATFISGGNTFEYLTSIAALNYFEQGGSSLLVTRVVTGSYTSATASVLTPTGTTSFKLATLSVGAIMNNHPVSGTTVLLSGSADDIRYEITAVNTGSGIFSISVRRGDDSDNNKTILESWPNLSLDPNQNNYISYVIGDQSQTVLTDENGNFYVQYSGSYVNKSNYIRVASVDLPTPNFFTSQGTISNASYTGSIPKLGLGNASGSFGGATGVLFGGGTSALNMFETIPNSVANSAANNIQGLLNTDYDNAIKLLGNKTTYDFNVVYAPGLTSVNAPSQITALLNLASLRGDCIAVVDMVGYGQQISSVSSAASGYDNSYGAAYWPWLQVRSRETGKINFVPASTLIPAVYEYNDKVSAEWFAPAGLNRGSLSMALQPERRLSSADRDTLYQNKVNPIASFAGIGTVIYGQKTLQTKPSALDRVNVRRLLIALKRYIGNIGETLVFEPNTQVTRNKFLNQVNPYLDQVQQKQGLYAFQVVMDETNNTPDVIDRNQLVGTIYLQPTRTAEFIQLSFNILPTGATFTN